MDIKDIGILFDSIRDRFPKFEGEARVWLKYFQRHPAELLDRALDEYTLENKYPPGISDFYKLIIRFGGNKSSCPVEEDAERLERIRRRRAAGYVPVADECGLRWTKEDYCVRHNGRWRLKIDYCMDILGARKVADMIRSEVGVHSVDSLTNKAFPIKKYKQLLVDMVELAEQDEMRGKAQ